MNTEFFNISLRMVIISVILVKMVFFSNENAKKMKFISSYAINKIVLSCYKDEKKGLFLTKMIFEPMYNAQNAKKSVFNAKLR